MLVQGPVRTGLEQAQLLQGDGLERQRLRNRGPSPAPSLLTLGLEGKTLHAAAGGGGHRDGLLGQLLIEN